MPIEVRHDPDYMRAYAQLASMRRQQQAAPAGYSTNPEADANPFTMSQQRGAQLSNKLAQDRERLGQKQGPKQDSYAGFNWLTPISIKGHTDAQGRALNDTVYRNDGVDPLATGAWGALGSAEHIVNDPNNRINIQDPTDRAKVEALSRSGISGMTDERAFMSPDEIEQQKYDKQSQRKQEEFTQQLETRDLFDEKKFNRKNEEEQRKAEQEFEIRQAALDASEDPSEAPLIKKERENIKNQIAAINVKIAKNPEFKAVAAKTLAELQARMARLKSPDQFGERVLERGADGREYYRQPNMSGGADRYSPQVSGAVKAPPKTFEQRKEEARQMLQQDLQIRQQFGKSPDEVRALRTEAERALRTTDMFGEKTEPTQQEIMQHVQEKLRIEQELSKEFGLSRGSRASAPPQNYTPIQAAVSSGRGQVESDPIKVTSIEDVGNLPSGTYFQDPEGNLRRVP